MGELALAVLDEARRQKAEVELQKEVIQFLIKHLNRSLEGVDGFWFCSDLDLFKEIEEGYGRG